MVSKGRNVVVTSLQVELNRTLKAHYEEIRFQDRDFIADSLVAKVEELIDELNAASYGFSRIEYSGDVDFENSEQWFTNGRDMGTGIVVHFHGFSARVTWVDTSVIG